MKFSSAFIAAVAFAMTATAAPVAEPEPIIKDLLLNLADKVADNFGLDQIAKLRGRYIGTATEVNFINDDKVYGKIATSKEFSQWTPENSAKWESIEPQNGVFDFVKFDALIDLARKHDKKVRGHTLVWHSQLPPWINELRGNPKELKKVLERHVKTVAKRYKGKIFQWDVVNEVFNEDGTYRSSIFYDTFGEDFIEWSFRWAREADPHAKLYINDYNFEAVSPKTTAVTNLVRKLKAKGVPVDGIGAQAHLVVGGLQDSMEQVWRTWAEDLKVDVALTELDIRLVTPSTPETRAQQVKDYAYVTRACVRIKRCVGITLWQFTDKYSWIPGVFAPEGDGTPWDMDIKKKTAVYEAIRNQLIYPH